MTLELKLLAALLLVASLFGGGFWLSHRLEEGEKAAASLKVSEAARAEEQRRTQAHAEILNEAQRLAVRARADAADVRAAAPGLRSAVATACGIHPAPAGASAPTGDTPVVLSNVLREAEERLRALAELADERGIAGQACVGAYDSLTAQKPNAPFLGRP